MIELALVEGLLRQSTKCARVINSYLLNQPSKCAPWLRNFLVFNDPYVHNSVLYPYLIMNILSSISFMFLKMILLFSLLLYEVPFSIFYSIISAIFSLNENVIFEHRNAVSLFCFTCSLFSVFVSYMLFLLKVLMFFFL